MSPRVAPHLRSIGDRTHFQVHLGVGIEDSPSKMRTTILYDYITSYIPLPRIIDQTRV